MKVLLLFVVGLTLCIVFTCKHTLINSGVEKYTVRKLDSINNYYILYVNRNDSMFKVVSYKPLIAERKCNKIRVGSSYPFLLRSSISWSGEFRRLSPKYNPQIGCLAYDDSTSICLESGVVRDLFHADNINGLCFIGK